MSSDTDISTQCGFVAIVGRPNVGKSTLLNHLIGQKVSITSRKSQTTRNQILGVWTEKNQQLVFVDTPGMQAAPQKAINRYMNRMASSAVAGVDVIVLVLERLKYTDEDKALLETLRATNIPIVAVVSKVDQIAEKGRLAEHLNTLGGLDVFEHLVPISAPQNHNVDELLVILRGYLHANPFNFPEDQVTDKSQRFMAAELVREKVMRQLGDEIPYALAVEIESFKDSGKSLHIDGLLIVEREGQKKIIIGKGGERIRNIGQQARLDMEDCFQRKVMLKLWVKVKSGWSDDDRALRSLGYD